MSLRAPIAYDALSDDQVLDLLVAGGARQQRRRSRDGVDTRIAARATSKHDGQRCMTR